MMPRGAILGGGAQLRN